MLGCQEFFQYLQKKGTDWYTGIPDSLLKDFCAYIEDHGHNTIAANEGGSIGLATGYHLATGKVPAVYMQNSGLGNIVNPITSLADQEVYSIPMLLIIGWRGEPGTKDEPQHIKQGRINEALLNSLEIPYSILSDDIVTAKQQVDQAYDHFKNNNSPYGLLVRKGLFEKYSLQNQQENPAYHLKREDAIMALLNGLGENDVVVSTTGKISREVFEFRSATDQRYERDFLTVGSMGHASQIALGIAMEKPGGNVICLDGDGATLMHMGALAIIGGKAPKNLKHVIFNNGSHDSVGGQPTVGFNIDFQEICKGSGYKKTFLACSEEELLTTIPSFLSTQGPSLLEIRLAKGSRKNLGRPHVKPIDNKHAFMKNLSSDSSN